MTEKKQEDPRERPQSGWAYLHLGTQFAATVGIFMAAGYALDRRYDWMPWGMLAGGVFGLAVGLYLFLKETL